MLIITLMITLIVLSISDYIVVYLINNKAEYYLHDKYNFI